MKEKRKFNAISIIWNIILYFNTTVNLIVLMLISMYFFIPAIQNEGDTYLEKLSAQSRIVKNDIRQHIYKKGLQEDWQEIRNSFYSAEEIDSVLIIRNIK